MDLRRAHDVFRLLGDETRLRLLAVLAEQELTVGELTDLLGLAQSRVSTHLGRLREAGLVKVRKTAPGSMYSVPSHLEDEGAARVWSELKNRVADPLLDQDRRRAALLVDQRSRSGSWADSVAGRMERHYSPGRTWQSTTRGLLGLVELGDVLDVASGDGALAELLAPRSRSVTCLDISPKVVDAARSRLTNLGNVELMQGDMHALPFDDASFDRVLLLNALSYAENPPAVVQETTRVLRPGGQAVVVALSKHAFADVARLYDHVQMGFAPNDIEHMLEENGLDVSLCAITHKERQKPHFDIITAHATKPGGGTPEN